MIGIFCTWALRIRRFCILLWDALSVWIVGWRCANLHGGRGQVEQTVLLTLLLTQALHQHFSSGQSFRGLRRSFRTPCHVCVRSRPQREQAHAPRCLKPEQDLAGQMTRRFGCYRARCFCVTSIARCDVCYQCWQSRKTLGSCWG